MNFLKDRMLKSASRNFKKWKNNYQKTFERTSTTLVTGSMNIGLSAKTEYFKHIEKQIKNEHAFKEWSEV